MFGFEKGLHETISGAILSFMIATQYVGQPDRLGQALSGRTVREPAIGGRTAVPTAPVWAPKPVPVEAPVEAEPEPIAA